jgi:hypothetical protein
MGIFSDIFVVVKIEELMMSDFCIRKKGDCDDRTKKDRLEGKGPQRPFFSIHSLALSREKDS